jgi:hypothetical protein
MKHMKHLMLLLAVAALIAGCALSAACSTSMTKGGGSAVENAGARMVVQYATMKYISGAKGAQAQNARASRVADVASKAQALAQGGAASTIPLIEQAVRDQIDWTKVDMADRLLIDNLITLVRAELEARVSDGGIPADQMLAVREVLGWVVSAASLARA